MERSLVRFSICARSVPHGDVRGFGLARFRSPLQQRCPGSENTACLGLLAGKFGCRLCQTSLEGHSGQVSPLGHKRRSRPGGGNVRLIPASRTTDRPCGLRQRAISGPRVTDQLDSNHIELGASNSIWTSIDCPFSR